MKATDAKQLADKALAQLTDELERGKSDQLRRYLAAMGSFHSYSFSNIMLIISQCPEATQVAGFRSWKKLGRWVRKGEHGIVIIAPMFTKETDRKTGEEALVPRFRAVYVFDVSQTDGEALPEHPRTEGDPGEYLDRLREVVRGQGIELTYSEELGSALGRSSGGRIALAPNLPKAEEFNVLAHELAHEKLHHQGERASKTLRETEAEAVAFVVSHGIGLAPGTASSDYIQLYDGDAATLTESLDRIQQTAAAILEALQPAAAQDAAA